MIRRLIGAVALASLLLGLPVSAMAQDAEPAVSIQDDLFSPATIQVGAGSPVTWSHDGADPHTVTADDGSFDSGVLSPGATFGFTFDAPGTYPYYCMIHGGPGGVGMSGVVVVN